MTALLHIQYVKSFCCAIFSAAITSCLDSQAVVLFAKPNCYVTTLFGGFLFLTGSAICFPQLSASAAKESANNSLILKSVLGSRLIRNEAPVVQASSSVLHLHCRTTSERVHLSPQQSAFLQPGRGLTPSRVGWLQKNIRLYDYKDLSFSKYNTGPVFR